MKSFQLSLALGALLVSYGTAAGASDSLSGFRPKVLPVLVQVDAQGKVTGASPATELSPKLNRLLRANLDEMIVSPAIDKKGRPTSSQFVMNLAVNTSPRPDGNYDVNFAFVSTAPVPSGSWYWVHTDGRQLALASQGSRHRQEYVPNRYGLPDFERSQYPYPTRDMNNIRSPAPAPGMDPAPERVPIPGKAH